MGSCYSSVRNVSKSLVACTFMSMETTGSQIAAERQLTNQNKVAKFTLNRFGCLVLLSTGRDQPYTVKNTSWGKMASNTVYRGCQKDNLRARLDRRKVLKAEQWLHRWLAGFMQTGPSVFWATAAILGT